MPVVLQADGMRTKAEQCERMAVTASDRLTAYTLHQLAGQWRDMADQLDKLESSPVYRTIRDRGAD